MTRRKAKSRKKTPRSRQGRWPVWAKPFLAALAVRGTVTEAAKDANITRTAVYDLRLRDAEFAKAWDDADAQGTDSLVAEAIRRARDGVEEPVIWQGRLCYRAVNADGTPAAVAPDAVSLPEGVHLVPLTINKRSDRLLMGLIQGRLPQYRSSRVEVSGAGGGPIESRTEHHGTIKLDKSQIEEALADGESSIGAAVSREIAERIASPDGVREPADSLPPEDDHGQGPEAGPPE